MKSVACVDQINNGYALLLYGENESEEMDIRDAPIQRVWLLVIVPGANLPVTSPPVTKH